MRKAMWLDSQSQKVLSYWIKNSHCPLLVSGKDGEIYYCNTAFEDLLGYTLVELKTLGWDKVTSSDIDVDKKLVNEIQNGERVEYALRKQYLSKAGSQIPVIIHVMRYPREGEIEFYLVSVIPIERGYEYAIKEIQEMQITILALTEAICNKPGDFERLWAWCKENKIVAAIIGTVLGTLIIGERFLSIIKSSIELFIGSGQ